MATAIHQYEDKLLDFAYGELPAPEASAVESHVKSCSRCTQALAQIRGVRTTMSALPQQAAPDAGLESLLAYAEQAARRASQAPRPQLPWWTRVVAPLAGAAALTLVAVVAWQTQDELDFSKESAALEAKHAREDNKPSAALEAPAPVVAAPVEEKNEEAMPQLVEPQKLAQKAKSGKISAAANAARGNEDRQAKEDRNWDRGLGKGGYDQRLGETQAPGDGRQANQRRELGEEIAAASKESKTRRATQDPATDSFDQAFGGGDVKGGARAPVAKAAPKPEPMQQAPLDNDFSNSRGGYVAEKAQNKKKSVEQLDALDEGGRAKDKAPPPKVAEAPPMGVTAAPASPRPTTQQPPQPSPAPAAAPERQSSLGLGLGTGSTGQGSSAYRSPSAYKQQQRDNSDDELASAGTESLADRKRLENDATGEQRAQESAARSSLEAARAAGVRGDRREEIKQALAVITSNVRGAPRAEALQRACTAYEELGEEATADKFCNLLIAEFPNSTAAKTIAQRRSAQRSAPKPSAKKAAPAYDLESEKAQPAEKSKAEQQPAEAY